MGRTAEGLLEYATILLSTGVDICQGAIMGKVRRFIAAGALLASAGLASCGADPSDGPAGADGPAHSEPRNQIAGTVREWAVDTTTDSAFEGDVTFAITNFGTMKHEFLVVKTDFEPGKIPLTSESRFDEEAEGLEVIDEIPEFDVKTTGLLTVNLDAGKYQLLCNIAGHYKAGMYEAFEVVKGEAPVVDAPAEGDGMDADAVSNDLHGSVAEWAVNVDAGKAKAGEVSFTMENRGTIQHEFLVVKTTYEHGKIPLGANNRFDEEDKGLSVIDEIPEWAPGVTNTLKVTLEPGKYELLCNIEGHYKNGMHAPFEVLP